MACMRGVRGSEVSAVSYTRWGGLGLEFFIDTVYVNEDHSTMSEYANTGVRRDSFVRECDEP